MRYCFARHFRQCRLARRFVERSCVLSVRQWHLRERLGNGELTCLG